MAHTSNGLSKSVAILTSDGTAPGDLDTLAKLIAKTPTDAYGRSGLGFRV